jgi:hypothetical protein
MCPSENEQKGEEQRDNGKNNILNNVIDSWSNFEYALREEDLYSALLDDFNLGLNTSTLDYPASAPSYLTITMRANDKNHLYPLVIQLRQCLDGYISAYNKVLTTDSLPTNL